MRPFLATIAVASLSVAACSAEHATAPESDLSIAAAEGSTEVDENALGSATLLLADSTEVGTATLSSSEDGLQLEIAVKGLEAGERAIHLHTTGLCEGPDFKSAGGHLNPEGNTHGSHSAGGRHLGDLPNITIGADGSLTQVLAIGWANPESVVSIFDHDGTAVMIHAGPDDYRSDPAGEAGPRIACGVLQQSVD